MTIQVGEKVPSVNFKTMTDDGPKEISSNEVFAGKKVVFFAVPGAFTPGCSMTHLPGFVINADAIKGKGVDEIVCMSVNDAFVMGAWGEAQMPNSSLCWRMVMENLPALSDLSWMPVASVWVASAEVWNDC